jgi:hypothetical protein
MKYYDTTVILLNESDARLVNEATNELDGFYFEDNGGQTDGPAYLILDSEIPADLREQLADRPRRPGAEVFCDGEKYELLKQLFALSDPVQHPWTGWESEGRLLVAFPAK